MAAIDPTRVFSVAGRLVIGPTNAGMLAGTYPYGSTAPVGLVTRYREIRTQEYAYGHSEARGRNKLSAYGGRYAFAAAFVLVQYDQDVLDKLYAYSTTSPNSFSGANILTVPKSGQATLSPGLLAVGSPLLFAAEDPSKPSTLILAPVWCLEEKLEADKSLRAPLETSVVVVAGIDANGNDVRIDKIENLALT